jgi:N-glycosylase/DNA lyase
MIAALEPYHLERTLRSGQCFRWTVADGAARGIVNGTVARVAPIPGGLRVEWEGPPGSPAALRRHLGADEPLAEIEAALATDRVLRRLLPLTSGIALMRQDPWECLVSYVISAFNNIPKIEQSVALLSRRFGRRITPGAWAFPAPARLADARLDELRACLLGYRAPYVKTLARLVARDEVDLNALAGLPYEDARRALIALPGVGEKVAECVLLFSLSHRDAFPVDVWVQRSVERWYLGGRSRPPRAIRAWARDRFGPLAGYAQQHLFAGARAPRPRSARQVRLPAESASAAAAPAPAGQRPDRSPSPQCDRSGARSPAPG